MPTEIVARAIAEAVIAGIEEFDAEIRPANQRTAYVLHVEQDAKNPDKWIAWQAARDARSPSAGAIYVGGVRGGGGLQLRIDKCTGAVSDVHPMR